MKFERILIQTILISLIYSSFIKCNLNVIKILNKIRKGDLSKEEVLKFYNKDYDPMLELNKIFTPCLEHLIDQESEKNNENLLNKIASSVREFFSGTYEDLNFPDLGLKVKCEVYINNLISPEYLKKKKEEITNLNSKLLSLAMSKNNDFKNKDENSRSLLKMKKLRKEADQEDNIKDEIIENNNNNTSTSGNAKISQKTSSSTTASIIKKNLNVKTSTSSTSHSYTVSGGKATSEINSKQITSSNSCEKNLEIFRSENEKLINDLKSITSVVNAKSAEIKSINDEKCKCQDKIVELEKSTKELQEEKINLHELINKSKVVNNSPASLDKTCAEKTKALKAKEAEFKTCNQNILNIELKLQSTKSELESCKGEKAKSTNELNVNLNTHKTEAQKNLKEKEYCESKFSEYKLVSEKENAMFSLEIKQLQKQLRENKFEKQLESCNKEKTELNINLVRIYDENNSNIQLINARSQEISILTSEKTECLKKNEICESAKINSEVIRIKYEKDFKQCKDKSERKLTEKLKRIEDLERQVISLKEFQTKYEACKQKEIPDLSAKLSAQRTQTENNRKEAEGCKSSVTQIKNECSIKIKNCESKTTNSEKQISDEKEKSLVQQRRADDCVSKNEQFLSFQSQKLQQLRVQMESNCSEKLSIQINLASQAAQQLESERKLAAKKLFESEEKAKAEKQRLESKISFVLEEHEKLMRLNRNCAEAKNALVISENSRKQQISILQTQIQSLNVVKRDCAQCAEQDSLKLKVIELEKELSIMSDQKKNCEIAKGDFDAKLVDVAKEREALLKKLESEKLQVSIKIEKEKKIFTENCQKLIIEEKLNSDKNKKLVEVDLHKCQEEKKQLESKIQQLQLIANYTTSYEECLKSKNNYYKHVQEIEIRLTEITNKLHVCENESTSCKRDSEDFKAKKLECDKALSEKEAFNAQCQKQIQETSDSYLKSITKIKSELNKQSSEITNINSYYINKQTEISNITNEISIEIKNVNIQINSSKKRKSEKDAEKQKLSKTIEDQKQIISELSKQKEDLRKQLKLLDKSDIVQIDKLYSEIEKFEINIKNTYIIIDKNILIFEQNCGEASQLAKEIEILLKNVEHFSTQETRVKETFKEMQTNISLLEKLVKESEIISNQYSLEFTRIIETEKHSEASLIVLMQNNLKKCESEFKITREKNSASNENLKSEIKQLNLSVNSQKSACIEEKLAIKSEFDFNCQSKIKEIELKFSEIQKQFESSLKLTTIKINKEVKVSSNVNISGENSNKIDLEMCIALISEPKFVDNNCKNLEALRKRYNQNCVLDPLPAPNKEILSFATYDLKDNNQQKLLRRLNI